MKKLHLNIKMIHQDVTGLFIIKFTLKKNLDQYN